MLQVVASHFGQLTDEASILQRRVVGALQDVRDMARAVYDGERGDLTEELREISTGLAGLWSTLELSLHLQADLETFATLGPRTMEELEVCGVELSGQKEVVTEMDAIASQLRADLPRALGPDAQALHCASLLRAKYSMAEQRTIHDSLVAEAASGHNASPALPSCDQSTAPTAVTATEEEEFEWF